MGAHARLALLLAALTAALLPARLDSATPVLRTRQISLPNAPLPKRPLLMQLNTRIIVAELSQSLGQPASLDDIPDAMLDNLAGTGFHIVYLLGVWRTGAFGLNKSKKLLAQDPCMAGFSEEEVGSSPFAITEYAVPEELGGDDALSRLCARIRSRRMRVVVDFVPNHVAIDHPWVATHPHFLIKSRSDEHVRDPGSYFESGANMFAFGRGLLWEPWEDTVQLNYGEPELRTAMREILRKIAGMVDGVRCDVAMLVEQELLLSTWGSQLEPERDASLQDTSEFWPTACSEARRVNPTFLFIAESYWEREQALMNKGFDFCYDKVFYDRLVQGDGEGIDHLLNLGRDYQDKVVRFLENHDEDRAASVFTNPDQHMAAAVLTFTSPGLHFVHDGQQAGRRRRISMHIMRRLPEDEDVGDEQLKPRYKTLLKAVKGAALRDGAWERCHVYERLGDGSETPCTRVMAHLCWSPPEGGGPFTEIVVCVVNYSPIPLNVRIAVTECGNGAKTITELLTGRVCFLSDRLGTRNVDIHGESLTSKSRVRDAGGQAGGRVLAPGVWARRVMRCD
jgi:hypothetical protein